MIWKLLVTRHIVVLDERDPTGFSSRIVALDILNGAVLWSKESPFGPWWSNLTAVSEERAILEGYAAPDMPIAKGVAALNVASGELAWIDREAQLLEVGRSEMRIRTSHHGIERLSWRSIVSGEPTTDGTLDEPDIRGLYPCDTTLEEIADVLTPEEAEAITAPIELLDLDGRRIISYYVANPRTSLDLMHQSFRCELIVMEGSKRVLRETLARQSPFPVAGNFVVESDILLYVQEKTRLVGVHLT